ncbi:MAG: helix-turn-helix domain-containing protein [Syntrophobacteraceae bacterium]|jgi:phage repressor protein C with HTH and peptisase S24 domain|nr:helix-turn-helix domain-containing protein [Syntrophobacteraceae bacterium]
MVSLGERLESLRGGHSIAEFAEMFGIHKNTYTNYVKRKNAPDSKFITSVCQKFGVNANWLLMGVGPKFLDKHGIHPDDTMEYPGEERFVMIPLIETWITDREGEIIHDGVVDYLPFSRGWFKTVISDGDQDRLKFFILTRVRSDSMSPTINRGDIILLDTSRDVRTFVRTGDIFLVRLPDGERALKRVAVCSEEGFCRVVFFSDNVIQHQPVEFRVESTEEIHRFLLGRVRWMNREF